MKNKTGLRQYAGAFKKAVSEDQEVQGLAVKITRRDDNTRSKGYNRSDALGDCFNSMYLAGGSSSSMLGYDSDNNGFGQLTNAIKGKNFASHTIEGGKLIGITENRLTKAVTENDGVKGTISILVGCFEGNKIEDSDGGYGKQHLKKVYVKEDAEKIQKLLGKINEETGANRSGKSDKTADGNKLRGLLAVKKAGKEFAKDVEKSGKSGKGGGDDACSWSSGMDKKGSLKMPSGNSGYKKSSGDDKCYLGIGDFRSSS